MLSKKALDEFGEIYLREYGDKLSAEDALEKATRLINLFKIIYKPIGNLTNSNKSGTI